MVVPLKKNLIISKIIALMYFINLILLEKVTMN